MNFEPPPNHGTDAQDENLELVDDYLLRARHRAILPHFGSFPSPEKNRSPDIAPTKATHARMTSNLAMFSPNKLPCRSITFTSN
jgi:hypothetical protein